MATVTKTFIFLGTFYYCCSFLQLNFYEHPIATTSLLTVYFLHECGKKHNPLSSSLDFHFSDFGTEFPNSPTHTL